MALLSTRRHAFFSYPPVTAASESLGVRSFLRGRDCRQESACTSGVSMAGPRRTEMSSPRELVYGIDVAGRVLHIVTSSGDKTPDALLLALLGSAVSAEDCRVVCSLFRCRRAGCRFPASSIIPQRRYMHKRGRGGGNSVHDPGSLSWERNTTPCCHKRSSASATNCCCGPMTQPGRQRRSQEMTSCAVYIQCFIR